MKKTKTILIILIMLIMMTVLVAGCQSSSPQSDEQNTPPADQRFLVAGIGLGDSTDEVKKVLGDEYTNEFLDEGWFGEPTSCWLYGDDVEVLIGEESNAVFQINLYSDGYTTSAGDKVGAKAQDVLPAYEDKYPLAQDHFEGNELPGWFVVEEGEWLIFNYKDDGTLVNQPIEAEDEVKSIHLVYEKFMH
ncbi:MAG: hypothetical protein ACOX6E_00110 [Syntrophomonadaceae bacterium]|jgi:hypothetical protein